MKIPNKTTLKSMEDLENGKNEYVGEKGRKGRKVFLACLILFLIGR